jgi:hypothetical protein
LLIVLQTKDLFYEGGKNGIFRREGEDLKARKENERMEMNG